MHVWLAPKIHYAQTQNSYLHYSAQIYSQFFCTKKDWLLFLLVEWCIIWRPQQIWSPKCNNEFWRLTWFSFWIVKVLSDSYRTLILLVWIFAILIKWICWRNKILTLKATVVYSDSLDTSTVSFLNSFNNMLGCIWLKVKEPFFTNERGRWDRRDNQHCLS